MDMSVEDMYRALLDDAASNNDVDYGSRGRRYESEDETEEFLTSKEIIQTKEALEDRYGILPQGDGVIEEDVHFKRYVKRRKHKYTEKEMAQIRESCIGSIVHDYGESDIYHLSDEERASRDILNELGMKLGGLKRTYRKVDQYIEAMRVVVQAWEMLEKKGNFIHSRDEFFQMVSEGRIVSNRIIMPKLKKMDAYNVDMIIKYISNPELDPSTLAPEVAEPRDSWYDSFLNDEEYESDEDRMLRVLSPDEFEFLNEHRDDPPEIKVKDIKPSLIKGYDRRDFGRRSTKKKKGNKTQRYIEESLHDMLNRIQNNEINHSRDSTRSRMITHSMFEVDKPGKDVWDDLYFDGSWANDNDVYLYDLAVREELLKQHPVRQAYLTFADSELNEFFKILESNGINTIDLRRKMDCPVGGTTAIEEKRAKKANRKVESALIQKITALNNNSKFKKIVAKAENALNKQFNQY